MVDCDYGVVCQLRTHLNGVCVCMCLLTQSYHQFWTHVCIHECVISVDAMGLSISVVNHGPILKR